MYNELFMTVFLEKFAFNTFIFMSEGPFKTKRLFSICRRYIRRESCSVMFVFKSYKEALNDIWDHVAENSVNCTVGKNENFALYLKSQKIWVLPSISKSRQAIKIENQWYSESQSGLSTTGVFGKGNIHIILQCLWLFKFQTLLYVIVDL